jgi:hypothetical protein
LLTSKNKIRRRKQVESEDKVRTDDYENQNPPSAEEEQNSTKKKSGPRSKAKTKGKTNNTK